MSHAPTQSASEREFERLLLDREARGLRVPLFGRLFMVGVGFFVVALGVANETPTDDPWLRPSILAVLGTLLALNLYLFGQLRRLERVERAGWIGAGFDALFVIALSVLAQNAGRADGLPPSFVYKSELPLTMLAMVVINGLALRPRYPIVVGLGALVGLLLPLVPVAGDAPIRWSVDRAVIYGSEALDPEQIFVALCMAIVVILSVVFAARSARRTALRLVEGELERARLQEAQLRAVMEEKVRAMSRLVAGISHEVNTPLGALGSCIDTQARVLTKLEEQASAGASVERSLRVGRRTLDTMRSAAERIGSLESSLRALSHLDEAEVREVDLAAELEHVIEAVQRERGRSLLITKETPPLPALLANASELNQALLAVVGHCADAAGEGGPVFLKAEVEGDAIRLRIGHRGDGLEPDALKRLFDISFDRGGGRVSAGFELAAAQSIAHRHGGELSASSTPEEGTTFLFELPFRGGAALSSAES